MATIATITAKDTLNALTTTLTLWRSLLHRQGPLLQLKICTVCIFCVFLNFKNNRCLLWKQLSDWESNVSSTHTQKRTQKKGIYFPPSVFLRTSPYAQDWTVSFLWEKASVHVHTKLSRRALGLLRVHACMYVNAVSLDSCAMDTALDRISVLPLVRPFPCSSLDKGMYPWYKVSVTTPI